MKALLDRGGPRRKGVPGVPSREWADTELVGAKGSRGLLSGVAFTGEAGRRDSGDPGGKRDVIGVISSTAWYAAVRGLPRVRDLSTGFRFTTRPCSTLGTGARCLWPSASYPRTSGGCRSASVTFSPPGTARPRTRPARRSHGGRCDSGVSFISWLFLEFPGFISRPRFGS